VIPDLLNEMKPSLQDVRKVVSGRGNSCVKTKTNKVKEQK
jgi:hypothetical protein